MRKTTALLPTVALVVGILFAVAVLLWMADVWGPLKPDEQHCALQLPLKWFGCVMGKQRDLAGGLIGAAGTIIAGILAWRAAMKTIEANRAKESAAFDFANERIGPIARSFNLVWRVVDKSLPGGGGDMSSGATLILALLPSEGLLDEWADQLESLAREFDIKRKVDLENVAGAVRRVRKCTEERKLTVIDEPWLRQLHATLNSLKHCCERFNPIGPDYFKGRNWSRLVEPPDLASVVDSFEEKGRIDGVPPGPVPRKGSS